jgi:serine/threonine protein kinase
MYIAMACYKGESLKDAIERGPLPPSDVIDIVAQVAEGPAKAHEKGIVHRDIKPGNIFVASDGPAKILDFGLAKLAGQMKWTLPGMTVGTVAYMSPEQVRGENVDARTDVRSLGVGLYEMVTGALPFRGKKERAVFNAILNDPRHRQGPEKGKAFLRQALKDAESRSLPQRDILKLRAVNKQFVDGDLPGALAEYRIMREVFPDFMPPWNNSGIILRSLGLYDEGEKELRQTLELEPDHAYALPNLAYLLFAEGKSTEAVPVFRRA